MEGDMLNGVCVGLDIIEMIMMFLLSGVNNKHDCCSHGHDERRRKCLDDWKSIRLVCYEWSKVAMAALDLNFCDSWLLRRAALGGRVEVT